MLQQGLMKRQKSLHQTSKNDMHIQDQINIVVITWNLFGTIPPNSSIQSLLRKVSNLSFKQQPDIIVFATQQCQKSLAMSFFCQDKAAWEKTISQSVSDYVLTTTQTLQGLHTGILIRKDQINCFTVQKKQVLRAGTCNILGNKGAVSILINLLGQNFQFINCHLPAHHGDSQHRNQVLLRIVDQLVDTDKRTQVIICGDLNYRINLDKQTYQNNIKKSKNTDEAMKYSKKIQQDQLINQQILKTRFLPYYQQPPITFPPTYKIAINQNVYNNQRIPGWTDRIFSRKGRIKQLFYQSQYNTFGSDHRPVFAGYQLTVQQGLSMFPQQFIAVKSGSKCSLI